MPFTPTILKENFDKYINNPKKLKLDLCLWHLTQLNWEKNLQAAIHPADFTARPQLLSKSDNPEYYQIIKILKKLQVLARY